MLLQPEHAAAGRASRARGEGGDQVVRAVVRALPVPHAHRRGPGLRGRGLGRDGVPDLHHRRHLGPLQPLAARPGPRARGRRSSTSSATSTGRAWWPRTSSRSPGSTRASTATRRARSWTRVYGPWMVQASGCGWAGSRSRASRTRQTACSTAIRTPVLGLLARQLRLQLLRAHRSSPCSRFEALVGRGDHGPGDADLPRALALPAPVERRLLRGGGRGGRARLAAPSSSSTVERPGILDDEVASRDRSERVARAARRLRGGRRAGPPSPRRRRAGRRRRPTRRGAGPGARPWSCGGAARSPCRPSLKLEYEGGKTQTIALRERERGGSDLETAPLLAADAGRRAVERPVEAARAHRRAPAALRHPRSRGPAGPRREPPQQLAPRRARRPRRRALGRALGLLAPAGCSPWWGSSHDRRGHPRRPRRRCAARPRLAVVLWLVNLSLALAAGVPGWLALRSAIGLLPGADALADGFSLGVLVDLVEMRPGLLGGLFLSALGVAGLGAPGRRRGDGRRARGAHEPATTGPSRTASGGGPGASSSASCAPGSSPFSRARSPPRSWRDPSSRVGRRMRRESGQEVLSNLVSLGGLAVAAVVVAAGAAGARRGAHPHRARGRPARAAHALRVGVRRSCSATP